MYRYSKKEYRWEGFCDLSGFEPISELENEDPELILYAYTR